MENVFEKDGFVYLKTGLTPDEFAKARWGGRMEECGLLATLTSAGWVFSEWRFEETEEDSLVIFVKGKAFPGQTLKDYFSGDSSNSFSALYSSAEFSKAKSARAAALVCSVTEAAVAQNVCTCNPCGGGIFISDDFTKLIFFPEQIFIQAALRFEAEGGRDEFGVNRAFYVNPALSGIPAARFSQSVVAYRALTGEFPFAAKNQDELSLDMADRNFIPLRNRIWAVDEQLASFVDCSLEQSAAKSARSKTKKFFSLPGGKDEPASESPLGFPVAALYRELGLNTDGSLPPSGKLLSVIRKSSVSPEDFDRAVKRETEKNARAVRAKRFLRKYRTVLLAAACSAAVFLAVFCAVRNASMGKPTTKGLTALETVEVFYSAYNTLNVNNARCAVLGKQPNVLVDVISHAYVTNQTRSAYTPAKKIVTPAEWMNYNNGGSYYMFGLSEFSVNEQKMELFAKPPLRKENPPAVAEERGKRLKEGDSFECRAAYFLVYPESEMNEADGTFLDRLHIEEYSDRVRLLFRDGMWRITEISHQMGREFFQELAPFCADYKSLLDLHGTGAHPDDVLLVANDLRQKYGWIPANSEILSAAQKLREEF